MTHSKIHINTDKPLLDVPVIILAGGLGTRLRSVVSDRPKPLATVGGRPFLELLLDQIEASGGREVVLATGYLGDAIESRFGRVRGPLRLEYVREEKPLGTGGAARLAIERIENDRAMIMNGDSFVDINLSDFAIRSEESGYDVSIAVAYAADAARFGVIEIDPRGRVVSFHEKEGVSRAGWINAGVYVVSTSLMRSVPLDRSVSLERDCFPNWICRSAGVYQTNSPLVDIGVPESLAAANESPPIVGRFWNASNEFLEIQLQGV